MAKNSRNFTISINHHICAIFHAENNLSILKFNFAHFIGPILTLRGPAPLYVAEIHMIITSIFFFHFFSFAEEKSMLVEIQREILQTLQTQKSELIQIQKEMLQTLKAAMSCCTPSKCNQSKGIRRRPVIRYRKK
jgi:hypothetical protein